MHAYYQQHTIYYAIVLVIGSMKEFMKIGSERILCYLTTCNKKDNFLVVILLITHRSFLSDSKH